ncbi:DddA-like double-stranded DNA deaminase toxin [Saccharothrix lopnurensis]|uniref:DddA-like double-stranded DNA deaminase toxin n=1 Tax=Saccharothrix lopnurensis TaxID=1670621 RepID=A0ABW1PE85_9PSEU
MASPDEMTAAVAAACDKASKGKEALGRAGDLAEEASTLLTIALEGGTTGDKDALLATFQNVVEGINALWRMLGTGMDLARLLGGSLRKGAAEPSRIAPVTPPVSRKPPTVSAGQARVAAPPAALPPLAPERIEQLRRDLPPTVVGGTGQKTHGRWIAPDGSTQREISGRDEWTPKVNTALADEGCPRLPVVTDADVELKLAARMREQGPADPALHHLTLVLNYAPCLRHEVACDEWIHRIGGPMVSEV